MGAHGNGTNSIVATASQQLLQRFGLFRDRENIGADFLQRTQQLRLAEVPREVDLGADLGSALLDPRIGRVGQHLADACVVKNLLRGVRSP